MICTHSSRKKDAAHTSWAEILRYSTILTRFATHSKTRSYDGLRLDDVDDVTIFCSGSMQRSVKTFAEYCASLGKRVYCVIQDPNWHTEISLECEYVLIHPFRYFIPDEEKDGPEQWDLFQPVAQRLGWDITKFSRMAYLPFGCMTTIIDSSYTSLTRKLDLRTRHKLQKRIHPMCYIGSLKRTRKPGFQMAAQIGCGFWGNFNADDFLDDDIFPYDAVFHGRTTSSADVVQIIQAYPRVAYLSDPEMLALDVHCIRWLEMALAGSTIVHIPLTSEQKEEALYVLGGETTENVEVIEAAQQREQALIERLNHATNPYEDVYDQMMMNDCLEFLKRLKRIV